MEEQIWRKIAGMHTPGFFITAEILRSGSGMPEGLKMFIDKKLELIRTGIGTRRFVFPAGEISAASSGMNLGSEVMMVLPDPL